MPIASQKTGRFGKTFLTRLGACRFLTTSLLLHIGLVALLGGAILFKATDRHESFTVSHFPGALQDLDKESEMPDEQELEFEEVATEVTKPEMAIQASALSTLNATWSFSINALSDRQVSSDATGLGNHALGTIGTGGRSGGSGGGSKLNSFFGDPTASATDGMAGAYYDFRRTFDGQPDPEWEQLSAGTLAPGGVDFAHAYLRLCEKLIDRSGNLSPKMLERYYRSPKQLINYVLLMPRLRSESAPQSFGVPRIEGRQAWLVNYRTKLQFGGKGRFRFVGGGDELLIVRVNGRLVLDGTWSTIPWHKENKNPTNWKPEGIIEGPFSNNWKIGEWVTVNGPFELEITVGEGWGGSFSGVLTIEEEGANYDGKPRPLFKIEGFEEMLGLIEPVVAAQSQFITLSGPTFQRVDPK